MFVKINRTYTADALSPDNQMPVPSNNPVPRMGTANLTGSVATPTMQQRMKNIGVATPLAVQSPVRRYENTLISFSVISYASLILINLTCIFSRIILSLYIYISF